MTSDDVINFLMAKADEILNVALVIKGLKKDSSRRLRSANQKIWRNLLAA